MTTKKLGIWMDHASAHLMEYNNDIKTNTILYSDATHADKEKTLQKGESMMQNKEQQQQGEYYKTIGEAVKTYEEVLIFGPTNAKTELLNILKADMHFNHIKIEILSADKMTGNQEQAFVRNYFSKN